MTGHESREKELHKKAISGFGATGERVAAESCRGAGEMSVFSEAERAYLSERKLGRLATIDQAGMPHLVPLGWLYNAALDTIDVGGRDFARTAKFKNVERNPNVALVVDDVLPPWRPRCVMIRGHAQALRDAVGVDGEPVGPIIRITPTQVLSWGLQSEDG